MFCFLVFFFGITNYTCFFFERRSVGIAQAISQKIQETHWNWSHQKFNERHKGEVNELANDEIHHALEDEGT